MVQAWDNMDGSDFGTFEEKGPREIDFQDMCEIAPTMDQDTLEKALQELQRYQAVLSNVLEEKRKVRQETTCHEMSIPGGVLEQVCVSDFLTVQECGRLLLLVSRSMLRDYGRQHAWEILCCRKWKNVAHIPKSISEQRGYEWIFRQLSISHYDMPLKPPSLSFETLTLMISIRNAAMKEVVSIALTGHPLKKFLKNGELNVSLKDKVALGKYPISEDGNVYFVAPRISMWTATMHLLRNDRAQCVCVHKTVSCCWGEYDYIEDPNIEQELAENKDKQEKVGWNNTVTTVARPNAESKIPPVEVDMGYMEFTTNGLELSRRGKVLEDRIRIHITGDTFECIKFEPTLICHSQDYCKPSNSVELVSHELRLDAWKRYHSGAAELYQSSNESLKHGVTLLHLLDHLFEWEGE
jgi:hypothetical protein